MNLGEALGGLLRGRFSLPRTPPPAVRRVGPAHLRRPALLAAAAAVALLLLSLPIPTVRALPLSAPGSVSGSSFLYYASHAAPRPSAVGSIPTGEWVNVTPASSPPGRLAAAMAYDGADHATLLFGGCAATICPTNDTWQFASGSWTNHTGAVAPPARWKAMMAFDPALGTTVLFGGCSNTTCQLNDTWEYRAGNWTNVTHGGAPPGRSDGSLVYDY
ncbi:MAG: hypothetical protein L3K07_08695, partial [Thermoplasmata archaeon]|nr:hypothetical protein [Thermoplasmata archaeon]